MRHWKKYKIKSNLLGELLALQKYINIILEEKEIKVYAVDKRLANKWSYVI